ncbi:hypothetical protein CO687_09480 [Streptococcus gordonii]|uniref:hypothetical protein n=1 Tax=Streptococcus gordonii TaxID=1302 RepID=UPI000BBD129B|nr:hypothetical protein [Streptococcus gordonii]ATF65678.1 hypothetical protein CO687_09480 [Streptococcus gordonii]
MNEISKLIRQYIDFFEQLNSNQHIDNSEYLIDLKVCEKEIVDYMEQLHRGITLLNKNKNKIVSSKDMDYTTGFVDIFLGLDGLEDTFSEFKQLSIKLNKQFMYNSGEITEKEYLDDGILNVEIVDEEEDQSGGI